MLRSVGMRSGLESAQWSQAARPLSRLPALLHGRGACCAAIRAMSYVGAAAGAIRAATPSPTLAACGTAAFAPAGAPTGRGACWAAIRAMFHVGAAAAANRAVTLSPTLAACGTAAFAPAGAPTWAWRLLADIRAMFHVGAAAAANRAVTPSPTLVACGTASFAPAGAPTWAWRLLGRHPHDVLCRSGGSREQGGHALTDAGRVRCGRVRACRRSYMGVALAAPPSPRCFM